MLRTYERICMKAKLAGNVSVRVYLCIFWEKHVSYNTLKFVVEIKFET